jgi:hypothetical protein
MKYTFTYQLDTYCTQKLPIRAFKGSENNKSSFALTL